MNKKLLYTKIFVGIMISFAVVKFIAPEIFITDSPQIKNHLPQYIASRIRFALAGTLSQKEIENLARKLDAIALRQIAKGIYAKENEEVSYTLIKDGQVPWKEYTFTVDGKEIKIKVPEGQSPPQP